MILDAYPETCEYLPGPESRPLSRPLPLLRLQEGQEGGEVALSPVRPALPSAGHAHRLPALLGPPQPGRQLHVGPAPCTVVKYKLNSRRFQY